MRRDYNRESKSQICFQRSYFLLRDFPLIIEGVISMKCLTMLQMLERPAPGRKARFLPLSGSTNAVWTIAGVTHALD